MQAGPESGANARRIGAAFCHFLNRIFEYARKRAAPAGVDRGDDAGLDIGQKPGNAVGGQNPKRQSRPVCHQCVGPRRSRRPRAVDINGDRRMQLVIGKEIIGFNTQRVRAAPSVFSDICCSVG